MTMTMKRSLTMTRPALAAQRRLAQERMRPPALQNQQALRAVDDEAVAAAEGIVGAVTGVARAEGIVAAAEGIVAAVTGVAGRGEREEDVGTFLFFEP